MSFFLKYLKKCEVCQLTGHSYRFSLSIYSKTTSGPALKIQLILNIRFLTPGFSNGAPEIDCMQLLHLNFYLTIPWGVTVLNIKQTHTCTHKPSPCKDTTNHNSFVASKSVIIVLWLQKWWQHFGKELKQSRSTVIPP
jgi:hypothetical protein